jgi:hypothetical protein
MVAVLRVTSALVFFVGAHLILLRVTNAAASLNNATGKNCNRELSRAALVNSLNFDFNSRYANANQPKLDISREYEPPNYGSPDSEHGSGTR